MNKKLIICLLFVLAFSQIDSAFAKKKHFGPKKIHAKPMIDVAAPLKNRTIIIDELPQNVTLNRTMIKKLAKNRITLDEEVDMNLDEGMIKPPVKITKGKKNMKKRLGGVKPTKKALNKKFAKKIADMHPIDPVVNVTLNKTRPVERPLKIKANFTKLNRTECPRCRDNIKFPTKKMMKKARIENVKVTVKPAKKMNNKKINKNIKQIIDKKHPIVCNKTVNLTRPVETVRPMKPMIKANLTKLNRTRSGKCKEQIKFPTKKMMKKARIENVKVTAKPAKKINNKKINKNIKQIIDKHPIVCNMTLNNTRPVERPMKPMIKANFTKFNRTECPRCRETMRVPKKFVKKVKAEKVKLGGVKPAKKIVNKKIAKKVKPMIEERFPHDPVVVCNKTANLTLNMTKRMAKKVRVENIAKPVNKTLFKDLPKDIVIDKMPVDRIPVDEIKPRPDIIIDRFPVDDMPVDVKPMPKKPRRFRPVRPIDEPIIDEPRPIDEPVGIEEPIPVDPVDPGFNRPPVFDEPIGKPVKPIKKPFPKDDIIRLDPIEMNPQPIDGTVIVDKAGPIVEEPMKVVKKPMMKNQEFEKGFELNIDSPANGKTTVTEKRIEATPKTGRTEKTRTFKIGKAQKKIKNITKKASKKTAKKAAKKTGKK